jgi:predicted nucleotidyltransferase
MGTITNTANGLGEALFTKTQRQVLGLLFGNPDRSFYAKEIVRHAGVGTGTVLRELEKLSKAGILTLQHIGNQKHYQANRESPIFQELRGLVIKTFGLTDVIRETLQNLAGQIDTAFIYGSVAKGMDHAKSDIDIMIISRSLAYPEILATLHQVEKKIGRKVNPTIYSPVEFTKRVETDNAFVNRIIDQPKIFLIGTEDDIKKP